MHAWGANPVPSLPATYVAAGGHCYYARWTYIITQKRERPGNSTDDEAGRPANVVLFYRRALSFVIYTVFRSKAVAVRILSSRHCRFVVEDGFPLKGGLPWGYFKVRFDPEKMVTCI